MKLNLLFASFIEKKYVDYVKEKFPDLKIIYRTDLIGKPRYPGDHIGFPTHHDSSTQKEWLNLVGMADIIFGFDNNLDPNLDLYAKKVKWIQATSSGLGGYLSKNRYLIKMPNTRFTTARGIHATPLAEFCIMAILMWSKNYFKAELLKSKKNWQRFSTNDISNQIVGIVGVGAIGSEIAKHCKYFNMNVFGIKNKVAPNPTDLYIDRFFDKSDLREMAKLIDYLILVAPQTSETNEIVNSKIFDVMKSSSYLINIGRGSLINENHLVSAIKNNTISGAALDVFSKEPLPRDSELWTLKNLILFPHSASTTFGENKRITHLFCRNLENFLNNKPLINQFNAENLY